MTYTDEYRGQRDAIVAAINTVADVGRVHDRPRHGDFRERWTATIDGVQQIRSWELTPATIEVIRREQGRRHRYRTWEINGVVAVTDQGLADPDNPKGDTDEDASFHIIQELAGEIADAFDTARAGHVAAGTWIDHEPTQIGQPQVITIGGQALCWGITLTIIGYTILTP